MRQHEQTESRVRPVSPRGNKTVSPGDIIYSRYRLLRQTEESQFSASYQAQDISGEPGALVEVEFIDLDRIQNVHGREARAKTLSRAHQCRHISTQTGFLKIYDVIDVAPTSLNLLTVVREYCSAGPMRELMSVVKFSQGHISDLIDSIANALHQLHRHNLTHGDLSPDTVYVHQAPSVSSSPFGSLGEIHYQATLKLPIVVFSSHFTPRDDGSLTIYNTMYMGCGSTVPEFFSGTALSPAADQFLLATFCYELCAERPCFAGATENERLLGILRGEPTPLPRIFSHWEPVIRRGLRKNPDERYADILTFAASFDEAYERNGARRTDDTQPNLLHRLRISLSPSLRSLWLRLARPFVSGGPRLSQYLRAQIDRIVGLLAKPGDPALSEAAAELAILADPEHHVSSDVLVSSLAVRAAGIALLGMVPLVVLFAISLRQLRGPVDPAILQARPQLMRFLYRDRALAVSRTPITQAQYTLVMEQNLSLELAAADGPVTSISIVNAANYCNRLSKLENLPQCYNVSADRVVWTALRDCRGYRLPTFGEWLYLATLGDEVAAAHRRENAPRAWLSRDDAEVRTDAVTSWSENLWGLAGLDDGVWEMVWRAKQPVPDDPLLAGRQIGFRIVRAY